MKQNFLIFFVILNFMAAGWAGMSFATAADDSEQIQTGEAISEEIPPAEVSAEEAHPAEAVSEENVPDPNIAEENVPDPNIAEENAAAETEVSEIVTEGTEERIIQEEQPLEDQPVHMEQAPHEEGAEQKQE